MESQSHSNTTMRAVGVSKYGPVENLEPAQLPKAPGPTGRQMLVRVRAVSVNPIDIKVRNGTYDDAPDYYERVAPLTRDAPHLHVMGYDGAGVVTGVGPGVRHFAPGDEVYYLGNPVAQGCYAEEMLVDERHAGHRPRTLDPVESAAMPLTYGTAYEALVGRLGIRRGERAGILIINGGGGVGSVASQIARRVLGLPLVITTASRPETADFSRAMGATHVVDHRGDIVRQIGTLEDLKPGGVPLRYAFITSRTEQYIGPIGDVLAPFGKVCSIVQARFDMYGSQFMSKSLTFSWCWLGSGAYHGYVDDDEEKHHRWFEELAHFLDEGTVKCHLKKRIKLTAEGLREAHREIEGGKGIGKIALGVDEDGPGEPFS